MFIAVALPLALAALLVVWTGEPLFWVLTAIGSAIEFMRRFPEAARVFVVTIVVVCAVAFTLFAWTGKPWVVLASIGVGGAIANRFLIGPRVFGRRGTPPKHGE